MTTIKFIHQVLIGTHVYGEGEVVEVLDKIAKFAIDNRHAVKTQPVPAPPAEVPVEVREAVNPAVQQARKATKKA